MRLVFVRIDGQTPLRARSPLHCPPIVGPCSNSTGTNPSEARYRAAANPAGPAPMIATSLMTCGNPHPALLAGHACEQLFGAIAQSIGSQEHQPPPIHGRMV